MPGKVGDRIIVESEQAGHPAREGQILGWRLAAIAWGVGFVALAELTRTRAPMLPASRSLVSKSKR